MICCIAMIYLLSMEGEANKLRRLCKITALEQENAELCRHVESWNNERKPNGGGRGHRKQQQTAQGGVAAHARQSVGANLSALSPSSS